MFLLKLRGLKDSGAELDEERAARSVRSSPAEGILDYGSRSLPHHCWTPSPRELLTLPAGLRSRSKRPPSTPRWMSPLGTSPVGTRAPCGDPREGTSGAKPRGSGGPSSCHGGSWICPTGASRAPRASACLQWGRPCRLLLTGKPSLLRLGCSCGTEGAGRVGLALDERASLWPAPGRCWSRGAAGDSWGPGRDGAEGPTSQSRALGLTVLLACPAGPDGHVADLHLLEPRGLSGVCLSASGGSLGSEKGTAQAADGCVGTLHTHVPSAVCLTQSSGQLSAQEAHFTDGDTEGRAVAAVAKGRLRTPCWAPCKGVREPPAHERSAPSVTRSSCPWSPPTTLRGSPWLVSGCPWPLTGLDSECGELEVAGGVRLGGCELHPRPSASTCSGVYILRCFCADWI